MARQEKRTIGGEVIEVTCVDARTALNLLQDLGASVVGFSGASVARQIGAAMQSGFRVTEIADTLGPLSTAGGKQLAKDGKAGWPEHFRGRIDAMTEWIAFLLEVNYENFTDTVKRLIERYEAEDEEKPSDG